MGRCNSEPRPQLAANIAHANEAVALGKYDTDDKVKIIRELTNGGADLVFQCANTTAGSVEGLQMVRKLGTFVEIGVPFGFGDKTTLDFPQIVFSKGARVMRRERNGADERRGHE